MAIRAIRVDEDPILRKRSREIIEINDRIRVLAEDLLETMYQAEGVGLAAPQVGILRRIVVIDVGEGPVTMINPEILAQEGSCIELEGCLSFPGKNGYVDRPEKVVCRYMDLEGQICEAEGEGLYARAICHELDHLNGEVYIDKVIEDYEPED